MSTHRLAALCATLAALAAGPALADFRITFKSVEGGGTGMTAMAVSGHKVRMANNTQGDMIFDGERQEMIVINHEEREYTRMDQATMEELAATVNAAMQQMEAAMASMPPEQRAQMQQMLGGKLPGLAGGEQRLVAMTATGAQDSGGGYPCSVYRFEINGKHLQDVCVASAADLGLPADALNVFQDAMKFTKKAGESMNSGFLKGMFDMQSFPGDQLPVKLVHYDGANKRVSEIESIDTAAVAANEFALPKGYKERKFDLPRR